MTSNIDITIIAGKLTFSVAIASLPLLAAGVFAVILSIGIAGLLFHFGRWLAGRTLKPLAA